MSSQNNVRSFSCFQIVETKDSFRPMRFKMVFKGDYTKARYAFGINIAAEFVEAFHLNGVYMVDKIASRVVDMVPDSYDVCLMEEDSDGFEEVWQDSYVYSPMLNSREVSIKESLRFI